ncbi:MAG: type II secretion system F family protein [Sedimentisphaerales bacterium]|nr:type II secretion system F family protein [Sedimentisphaerales bacterium]
MSKFSYKAVNKSGEHITGTLEAVDRKSAVSVLTGQGHFVTELMEGSKAKGEGGSLIPSIDFSQFKPGKRVSTKDILAMTTQLSTALKAGLPLINGLELIQQQQTKIGMKEMLTDLISQVSSGQSLSDAMEKHPKIFSPLYISMIRVGETGGILEQTTEQLASILNRDDKVKTNMKNASAYPIFVLVIGMTAVTIIITWILPKILDTITSTGAALPLPTRILIAASDFAKIAFTTAPGLGVIACIIAGFLYFKNWTRTKGRLQWDSFKLKIPILGNVLRTIAVGRFARTLGSLTRGGVIILEALAVVRDTLGNELLGQEIDIVAEKVKRGESLAEPLSVSGYFPPLLVQITAIGEETGKLDEMLLNAAETFDAEADSALNKFMAIFPALLILVLAVIIGFIIIATLLPIVTMQLSGGM